MLKMYKPNENMCKELHAKLNMNLGPTKLVKPTLFLLADIDDLQKQVNRDVQRSAASGVDRHRVVSSEL